MRRELIYYLKGLLLVITILVLLGGGACTLFQASTTDSVPIPTTEPVQESETTPSPTDLIPRITIEELLVMMETKTNLLIVDTRDKELYDAGHIKGAESVPLSVILEDKWTPPSDKALILYCGWPKANPSARAALQLINAGFSSEIKVLLGGYDAWKEAGYPIETGSPQGNSK